MTLNKYIHVLLRTLMFLSMFFFGFLLSAQITQRDLYGDSRQIMGLSNVNNKNINHKSGTSFQNQKRAVVLLMVPSLKPGVSFEKCTGTILNTIQQNGKAYILAASHCMSSNSVGDELSIYLSVNYEMSEAEIRGIGEQNMNITTVFSVPVIVRVHNPGHDLLLLEIHPSVNLDELFSPEGALYDAYASGWSISPYEKARANISHPRGDHKKIFVDPPLTLLLNSNKRKNIPLKEGGLYYRTLGNWNNGSATPQKGSSGSGLLNPEDQVMAVLSTGKEVELRNTFSSLSNAWYPDEDNVNGLQQFLDPDQTWVTETPGGYIRDLVENTASNFTITISPGETLTTPVPSTARDPYEQMFFINPKFLFESLISVDNVQVLNRILGIKIIGNTDSKVYMTVNAVGPADTETLIYGAYVGPNSELGIGDFKASAWDRQSPPQGIPQGFMPFAPASSTDFKAPTLFHAVRQAKVLNQINPLFIKEIPVIIRLLHLEGSDPVEVQAVSYPGQVPTNALQLFDPDKVVEKYTSYEYKQSAGQVSDNLYVEDILISQNNLFQYRSTGNNGGYLNLVNSNFKIGPINTSYKAGNSIEARLDMHMTLGLHNPNNEPYTYAVWIDYFNRDVFGGSHPVDHSYNFVYDPALHEVELFASGSGSGTSIDITGTMPFSDKVMISAGNPRVTRLRVSVKKGTTLQTQGEIFEEGEVEDYLIEIKAPTKDEVCKSLRPADYAKYAEGVLPYCVAEGYFDAKLSLSSSYQLANTTQGIDLPGGQKFEVGELNDVPFATAWGKHYSFNGRKQNSNIAGLKNLFIPRPNESKRLGENDDFLKLGQLKMDIYYPKGKEELLPSELQEIPVIIHLFGGGFVKNDDGDMGPNMARLLASQGYLVASIDYRLGMAVHDGELSKRAMIRAWQDLEAAVKYWRFIDPNGPDDTTHQGTFYAEDEGVIHKWNVDPFKIYGVGHSAGAITLLHNIYLTREKYDIEKQPDQFLQATGADYAFPNLLTTLNRVSQMGQYYQNGDFTGLFSGNRPTPAEATNIVSLINTAVTSTPYLTYALDDFPTVPCIGIHSGCSTDLSETAIQSQNTIIDGYELVGELDRGVAFSGAVMKGDWMIGNSTPVRAIHHQEDIVVSPVEDEPFSTYGDLVNLFNIPITARMEKLYGASAMDEVIALNPGQGIDFDWKELTGNDEAGGSSPYHRSTQKFKSNDRNALEPKLMYYVDAFFTKGWSGESGARWAEIAASKKDQLAEEKEKSTFNIFPNPSDGNINILYETVEDDQMEISIYDLQGKVVYQQELRKIGKGIQLIQLYLEGKLSPGVYQVVVTSAAGVSGSKVVIQ